MAVKEIKRPLTSLKNEYWLMKIDDDDRHLGLDMTGPYTSRNIAEREATLERGKYLLLTRVAEVEVVS